MSVSDAQKLKALDDENGRLRNIESCAGRPLPPTQQINYQPPGSHNERGIMGRQVAVSVRTVSIDFIELASLPRRRDGSDKA